MEKVALLACLEDAQGPLSVAVAEAVWRRSTTATDAHPGLELSAPAWAEALVRALGGETASDPAALLERLELLRIEDLWMSTAVGAGDALAVARFERDMMPEVDRALRRFSMSADEASEMRQRIRIHLLVSAPGTAPKISQYAGQGSLGGWVRTVAARQVLNARRGRRETPIEEVAEVALRETPEFTALRVEHRALFIDLLKAAFRSLDQHGRTLLRLRYANAMTAAALSRAYGVHESTISRQLASARKQMAAEFERLAQQKLGSSAAVPELLAVMQSRVEASLHSLFATVSPVDNGPPHE